MSDEAAPVASAPAQQEASAAAPANPRLKLSLDDLVATNKPKKATPKQQKKNPAPKKTKPVDRQARSDAAAPYQPRQAKQRRERRAPPMQQRDVPASGLQIQFNAGGPRGGHGGPSAGAAFDGHRGRAPYQGRPSHAVEPQVKPDQPHKLMILNLHDDVEAGDLQEIFGEVGKVLGSKVDRNADGSSKGTGEVLLATRAQAEKAKAEFDAADVNGRIIGVRMLGAAGVRGRVHVQKHQQGAPQQQGPFAGRGGGHPHPAHGYGGFQGAPQGGRGGPVQFQVTLDSAAASGVRPPRSQQGGRQKERRQPVQQRSREQGAPAKHGNKQHSAPQQAKASKPKPKQPRAAPKPVPTQAEMDAEMAAYMAKTAQ